MINTEINLVRKKVNDLLPYENNPRDNEEAVDPVSKSIVKYGYKVPIIIDSSGTIITGHTRLKALQKLGVEEVDVILADDLSEEQVKEFRLVDNKVSEFAKWEPIKLEEELAALENSLEDFGLMTLVEVDVDQFFEDGLYEGEKKKKTIKCPHCGEEFEV